MSLLEYMDRHSFGTFLIVSAIIAGFFTVLNNAVKVFGARNGVHPDELENVDDD